MKGPKASNFRQLLNYCNVDPRSSNRLAKVAELIRLLIGKAGKGHCEAVKDDDNQNEMENGHASSKDVTSFRHPYKELFLWALLMNQLVTFLIQRDDLGIPVLNLITVWDFKGLYWCNLMGIIYYILITNYQSWFAFYKKLMYLLCL